MIYIYIPKQNTTNDGNHKINEEFNEIRTMMNDIIINQD